MSFDRLNTVIVCAAAVLILAVLGAVLVVAHGQAEDLHAEKEHTEQARIDACSTIEDAQVRALCIVGSKP